MKTCTGVLFLVVAVLGEAPAPYPPSGWRPSGPAFELPPRGQPAQNQESFPQSEPRNSIPNSQYGAPNDVSVQGLPTQEQQPIFQTSPINGQQIQGPSFNSDIKNLDQNLRQAQYQQQQETYRQFQRQRQLDSVKSSNKGSSLPSPQSPRQFASKAATPKSTTPQPEPSSTEAPLKQVTEPNLNEREILEDEGSPAKLRATSVEITKQNIQQYPGELFLSSLAQLQLQPQFVPLQQIRASYVQSGDVAPKLAGFDGPAHLAALPSVLAQQQVSDLPSQAPQLLIGEQLPAPGYIAQSQYQPSTSYQPQSQFQQPVAIQPQAIDESYLPVTQNAFVVQQPTPQYQPAQTFQPQIQAQPVVFQPQQLYQQPSQIGQVQPKENNDNNKNDEENQDDAENINNYKNQQQPQQVYQPAQQDYQQSQQDYQQSQNNYQHPQQEYQQPQQDYQTPQEDYQQTQQVYVQPQRMYQQQQQAYQQPQQVYQQPQQVYQQPQQLYQQPLLLPPQPVNQYQAPEQFIPAQLVNQDQFYLRQYQPQLIQGAQQQNFQPQDALQSGLDVSNEDNDIDQAEDKETDEDDAPGTTAVATAFGARTQPRMFTQYGAPLPEPRARRPAPPKYSTTTESTVENVTGDADIAEAVAVSSEIRKKNGRLRTRRIRPVIAVDRSGRLLLAAE